jgi:hypothetical protein
METFLLLVVPAILLAYLLKIIPASRSNYRLIRGLLLTGTAVFYAGLLLLGRDPGLQSIFKLGGACLFFTGAAFHFMERPAQDPAPAARGVDQEQQDSDSAPD